jgi:hypothetical protein
MHQKVDNIPAPITAAVCCAILEVLWDGSRSMRQSGSESQMQGNIYVLYETPYIAWTREFRLLKLRPAPMRSAHHIIALM